METNPDASQHGLMALAAEIMTTKDPLVRLAALRSAMELLRLIEAEAVQAARTSGATWLEVGDSLGVSKQAAAKRFMPPNPKPPADESPAKRPADRTGSSAAGEEWNVTTPGGWTILRLRRGLPAARR